MLNERLTKVFGNETLPEMAHPTSDLFRKLAEEIDAKVKGDANRAPAMNTLIECRNVVMSDLIHQNAIELQKAAKAPKAAPVAFEPKPASEPK